MSMYLEEDILQDILCTRLVWNTFKDKVFEFCVEFIPYFFSCRDHRHSSSALFISLVSFNCTPSIVHVDRRDFTKMAATLSVASYLLLSSPHLFFQFNYGIFISN